MAIAKYVLDVELNWKIWGGIPYIYVETIFQMFSINENSLTGIYGIYLSQNEFDVGFNSFFVFNQSIPDSAKSNARYIESALRELIKNA